MRGAVPLIGLALAAAPLAAQNECSGLFDPALRPGCELAVDAYHTAQRVGGIAISGGDPEPGAIGVLGGLGRAFASVRDRKSTRLNSSHVAISYAVFCLKKKKGRISWRTSAGTRSGWAFAQTASRVPYCEQAISCRSSRAGHIALLSSEVSTIYNVGYTN